LKVFDIVKIEQSQKKRVSVCAKWYFDAFTCLDLYQQWTNIKVSDGCTEAQFAVQICNPDQLAETVSCQLEIKTHTALPCDTLSC
jgi:hypothetical protein